MNVQVPARAPQSYSVGCEPPRATLTPHHDVRAAVRGDPSPRVRSLNGEWRFHWSPNTADPPEGFAGEGFDDSGWGVIPVPSNWQFHGYDEPTYLNVRYPWVGYEQPEPPDVPVAYNPVGRYRRRFEVPEEWRGQRILLSFQGVKTAFRVWLNGTEIGGGEDSYAPAEFDVTAHLRAGPNTLAVEVYRWAPASWLEDQDMIDVCGIFRDVFLYAVPEVHIRDVEVRTDLDDAYTDATLRVRAWVRGGRGAAGHRVTARLYDGEAEIATVAEEVRPEDAPETVVDLARPVAGPRKWSAEHPDLYTLAVALEDPSGRVTLAYRVPVGFRRFERAPGGPLLINGKPITFRGVNRHETDPDHGQVMSAESMLRDILIMKRNNVNAVRTSHYPNDPAWLDLCDRYGLYVVDEANLETHGMRRTLPGSDPVWREPCLERVRNLVERDKNHPSVLVWSLGNEAGKGDTIAALADWVHDRDPSRPVHYEQWNAVADMVSWMYAPPEAVEEYGRSGADKPYILCEYAHAMGNSVGNLTEYWSAIERYPNLQGGFVWDFADQMVRRPRPDGSGTYLSYGGDWGGGTADDGNFCANGLVDADRAPHPHLQEVRHVYQPVGVREAGPGAFAVTNKLLFTDLDAFTARWTVTENGVVTARGELGRLAVPPGETATVPVPGHPVADARAERWLNLEFALPAATAWAEAGHVVARDQIRLAEGEPVRAGRSGEPVAVEESAEAITVTGGGLEVVIDRGTGTLSAYRYHGVPLLAEGPVPCFWRAPTDNDIGHGLPTRAATWRHAGRDRRVTGVRIAGRSADAVRVEATFELPTEPSASACTVMFDVDSGGVDVAMELRPGGGLPEIPAVGMLLTVPGRFDRLAWFGRGPHESYWDRKASALVGRYDAPVEALFHPYVRPQATGNLTDVRFASLTDADGTGLTAQGRPELEVCALRYTPWDLEGPRHAHDLVPRETVAWQINHHQMGLGGTDSWGQKPLPQYILDADRSYSYAYRLAPATASPP